MYILIAFCAFFTSFVTFYSGFGLGTILMPVIAIFFPLPLAIILTAFVHLFHNLLKGAMLWKSINWNISLRFGSVALLAAIPGAWLLNKLSFLPSIGTYSLFGVLAEITFLKLIIGTLLIIIATTEALQKELLAFKNIYLGGVISGFFGGLSGNQGAFRSLFLINVLQDPRSFIASNAFISMVIDITRLIIYSLSLTHFLKDTNIDLLAVALASATFGVILGMILLKKITIALIQKVIIVLLYLLGCSMLLGII
jgi:hypothetical protein